MPSQWHVTILIKLARIHVTPMVNVNMGCAHSLTFLIAWVLSRQGDADLAEDNGDFGCSGNATLTSSTPSTVLSIQGDADLVEDDKDFSCSGEATLTSSREGDADHTEVNEDFSSSGDPTLTSPTMFDSARSQQEKKSKNKPVKVLSRPKDADLAEDEGDFNSSGNIDSALAYCTVSTQFNCDQEMKKRENKRRITDSFGEADRGVVASERAGFTLSNHDKPTWTKKHKKRHDIVYRDAYLTSPTVSDSDGGQQVMVHTPPGGCLMQSRVPYASFSEDNGDFSSSEEAYMYLTTGQPFGNDRRKDDDFSDDDGDQVDLTTEIPVDCHADLPQKKVKTRIVLSLGVPKRLYGSKGI